MSKKLAIKGHPTRGKEVIELLEMLGGNNRWGASGVLPNLYYFISNKCIIYSSQIEKDVVIFTLEEFLEKYPFKVGDKAVYIDDNDIVVISGIEWDDTVSDIFYNVKRIDEDECFLCPPEVLKPYKETNMNENKLGTAVNPVESKSNVVGSKDDKINIDDNAIFVFNHTMRPEVNVDGMLCYKIPNGYESFSIQEDMIILKPKKPKYPKTFEECLNILYCKSVLRTIIGHKAELLLNLEKLLICRDAYWKIAGKEMGLDKPWEPDWKHLNRKFYCIYNSKNNIVKNVTYGENKILAFPTEEMRDAFYENFKELIEQCKELL